MVPAQASDASGRTFVPAQIDRDMDDRTLRLEHEPKRALAYSFGYFLGTGSSGVSPSAKTAPGFEASAKSSVAYQISGRELRHPTAAVQRRRGPLRPAGAYRAARRAPACLRVP